MSALAAVQNASGSLLAGGAVEASTAGPDVCGACVPPITFVYKHLHDAIRAEFARMTDVVSRVERRLDEQSTLADLRTLRDQYHLLVQVNRCHSSVEDEVVYPALEAKVPNVTQAYSVEHGEEDHLLDKLQVHLDAAISAPSDLRAEIIHEFVCKAEEVHVTLQKHLRKEEEQLFPLLLRYFSYEEQADLVVQFICCIPVLEARHILNWLRQAVSDAELGHLLSHINAVRLEEHLHHLVTLWLAPPRSLPPPSPSTPSATAVAPASARADPLAVLVLMHQGILHMLDALTRDLRASRGAGTVTPLQHGALVARWHFLAAVSACHRASEEQTVYSAARALGRGADAACCCQTSHAAEAQTLTSLRRLLGDLEAGIRRGTSDVAGVLAELTATAEAATAAMRAHTDREEAELLPALRASLDARGQRDLAWRTLQALPLRHLEQIVPWIAQHLGGEALSTLVAEAAAEGNAPDAAPLVALVALWARRAAASAPGPHHVPSCTHGGSPADAVQARIAARPHGLQEAYPVLTCAPSVVTLPHTARSGSGVVAGASPDATDTGGKRGSGALAYRAGGAEERDAKSRRLVSCGGPDGAHAVDGSSGPGDSECTTAVALPGTAEDEARVPSLAPRRQQPGDNPIDHIFQFHKTLRAELREIEAQAKALQALVAAAGEGARDRDAAFGLALQRLEGRFLFVSGIYQAHSISEDEVVFPALEAKSTLRNISTFYVLDHQEEATLFADLGAVIAELHSHIESGEGQRVALVSKLRQKCASVRAALETHVRAEEAEIWPLFTENFSREEQSTLVGAVIGRTGAVVLQALIPWVTRSVSDAERDAMMGSLRDAAKNTRFEAWLTAMVPATGASGSSLPPPGTGTRGAGQARRPGVEGDAGAAAANVEGIAAATGPAAGAGAAPQVLQDPGAVADTADFRPGWGDIFRMNLSQLEAAAAASPSSARPGEEEEHRRRYLLRHLMVARFLVAQQACAPSDPTPGPSERAAPPSATEREPVAVVPPVAAAVPSDASSGSSAAASEVSKLLGCKHYRTRCKLVAACCGNEVWCRQCHDEAGTCGADFDRYAVREMVCQLCGTRQAVAQDCRKCRTRMARYHCSVCNLFDDTPGRNIYHCPFCNMCRRGRGLGVDAFHCMRCNACMSLTLFNRHVCREHAMEGNCPICADALFESALPVKELPCGHLMHSACFAAHTQHRYTCPVCYRSVGDLSLYFEMLDRLLVSESLPAELVGRRQTITCNDCGTHSDVAYHYVYHKCQACSSYNTRIL